MSAGGLTGVGERALLRLRVLMRLGWFSCFFRLCRACGGQGGGGGGGKDSGKKDNSCYGKPKQQPQHATTQTLRGHIHKAFEGSIGRIVYNFLFCMIVRVYFQT